MDEAAALVQRWPDKPNIGFAWAHRGRELVVMDVIKGVPTGFPASKSVNATPACIIPAGSTQPLRISTSGWTKRPGAETLDNERWTALVRQFSKAVGFQLHWSIRDTPKATERVPENDGRYLACHAEKKLGLFFLSLQIRSNDMSLEDALHGKLRDVNLPLDRRRAQIYLGHKPCKNCLDFLKLIRRRTGIDIRTSTSRVFSEHKRKRTFYVGVRKSTEPLAADAPLAITNDAVPTEDDDEEETTGSAEELAQQKHSYDSEDDGGGNEDSQDAHDDIIESIEVDDDLEALEEIIETLPTGNITRPRQKKTPDAATGENNKINNEGSSKADEDKKAMPPPASHRCARMSVHSTPSPSPSIADSATDRRRYQTYSSPSHGGVSVAPPSVWGDRGKPPVTPCLEAPDETWGGSASPYQQAYGQSYFFGTPSVASTQNIQDSQEGRAHAQGPDQQQQQQQQQQQRRLPASTTASGYDGLTSGTPPPAPVYVPPYLRRLQRTLNADTSRGNARGTTARNPARAREPTPIVDLTGDADGHENDDNDVELLARPPGPSPSSSSPATNNNPWHPPMRPVGRREHAHSAGRISRLRGDDTPCPIRRPQQQQQQQQQQRNQQQRNQQQRSQQAERAARRGVAVPVRRRRGHSSGTGPSSSRPSKFPNLSAYRYADVLE